MNSRCKVGLLGAGYIAKWHADALRRVPHAALSGVCDLSQGAAKALAKAYGVETFPSLETMLASEEIDCVHVLTPPPAHYDCVRQVIEAGKHVFVEKPFVLSSDEARRLTKMAEAKNVKLGVNHNFLMLPGYEQLRRDMQTGEIGAVDAFRANWRFPLPPLRSGPFGLWMLRAPENLLFELGPHLFAFAADLFGEIEVGNVDLRYPITLPGGVTHYQAWRIDARAAETAVTLDLSLIEGHDDRSIEIRGLGALARFNFADDSYRIEQTNFGDIVIGPLAAQLSLAGQAAKTAIANASRQLASLNALAPYGLSITRACKSFYASIEGNAPIDRRLTPSLAGKAIRAIEQAAALAAPRFLPRSASTPLRSKKPTMLVIGGTGFIGRYLVKALLEAGYGVRVFSRSRPVGLEGADVFTGDLKSEADLLSAMEGIDGVFHLARAEEKSWAGYVENDVRVARLVGECCLKAGCKRLVYTGTIDSYDASRPDCPITEETPFDRDLERRNLYARSKAASEAELVSLSEGNGLGLVIVRPGIVIGAGGPLQHWGVAMWRGATVCKLWGRGDNVLPFVAVDDVADGLVRAMTTSGIEGRSFNLIGDPMLSAKEYLTEVGAANGVKIRARPTPIVMYYLVDVAKYWAKRLLARQKGLTRPCLRDWKSRSQLSPYNNEAAKTVLGWRPETDRRRFIDRVIVQANLFGTSAEASGVTARARAGHAIAQ